MKAYEKEKENVMGTKSMWPLLISMSIPPMISMLIQSLYNVVDSIFVTRYSQDALTAVSLVYPLQNLVLAVSVGFSVGLNACIARNLGAGNKDEVGQAAMHGLVFTLVHYVIFAIGGLFLARPFLQIFTDDAQILEMSCQYAQIVLCVSIGNLMYIYYEKLFQSTGHMLYPMFVQAFGALFNIVMDPILIFGWFGLPEMGVRGAAIATVGAQIVAAILGGFFFYRYNTEIHMNWKTFRLSKNLLKDIYGVGIPSAIVMALPSILVSILNSILVGFSQAAVGVFGLYYKLQTMIYMPSNGILQGMRPVISYNYGAENSVRVKQAVRVALTIIGVIGAAGTLISVGIPEWIMGSVFGVNGEMFNMGVTALRIIGPGFLISAIGFTFAGYFEALGSGIKSLAISLTRQLIVLTILAYVLSQWMGVNGVWIAFPIAEVCASVLGIVLYRRNRVDRREVL